ncbi:MAG: M48 family metallopeptidase [Kiritimatiellia bacterium]|jgi:STE24 endopeptidase|nr:M48 family metallopeptidase [Kiritimatiellia bacterium]MDP6811136.1 M48 family metallopeptidase [Kiritimatiellia bacterium]MDP7023409.1 M48 family metallopeptidase [Kiritimatiellia bacterium]
MNGYLVIVVGALLLRFLVDVIAELANLGHVRTDVPAEFEGLYDAERYATSQRYLRDTTRAGLLHDVVTTMFQLGAILLGGFCLLDALVRMPGWGPIPTGLLYAGALALVFSALDLPFSIRRTFILEARYGFNRTTPRTFVLDILKGVVLSVVIGAPLLAAVIWFFERFPGAWWMVWALLVGVQVALVYLAPLVIMPLFNTFTPLGEGEVRQTILEYARAQSFPNAGIFTMDGSRRSSKSNAFFTGFGRSRRIVLYDTFLERHTAAEILAVVAHEMGHYKKRHIPAAMVRSVVVSGITCYLLGCFINNPGLFAAFGFPPDRVSVYASLVLFGFLYTPLGMVLGIVEHAISRRHEYEADAFTVDTCEEPGALSDALKKLSVDNLSNLAPHPLKVAVSYSHPPVLYRIRAIQERIINRPTHPQRPAGQAR